MDLDQKIDLFRIACCGVFNCAETVCRLHWESSLRAHVRVVIAGRLCASQRAHRCRVVMPLVHWTE
eukprot:2654044-Pyramimonas_sp.AAC.1